MTQANSRPRHSLLLVCLLISLLAAAALWYMFSGIAPSDEWIAPSSTDSIVSMLQSDRPEERAAACAWVGRHRESAYAPALFPRMSDADWRVRAAAFDAMRRVAEDLPDAPADPPPLRDTPAADREHLIFRWLSAWRSAGPAAPVTLPELCELYAINSHWLSGPVIAEACLACHAPPAAYTFSDYARCSECHQAEHATWAASAHAQSLTHIGLKRVDETTKQVVRYDFGDRRGVGCFDCHRPTAPAPGTAVPPGTESLDPPHHFHPAAADSCTACHTDAHQQWHAWTRNPRPRPAHWPPGQITWDDQPETRDCVSCHMASEWLQNADLRHDFLVRRDRQMLLDGLIAHIEPATEDASPVLVLTNLAGHAYPTGTTRRALRIELIDNDDDSTRRILLRLTGNTLPTPEPRQSALAPGEQRRIALPSSPNSSRITCIITYERNQFAADALEVQLYHLSQPLARPFTR